MSGIRAGVSLLAEPFLEDPNFKRSAVAVVDHDAEGTVGFVLTHVLDWKVTDVMPDFPEFDAYLRFGGPVQRDTLHYVHTLGDALGESSRIGGELFWGGDFEQLTTLIATGVASPANVQFFLGYSGWSAGQLDEEMVDNTWVVGELSADMVFATPPEQVWQRAMSRLGDSYGVIGQIDGTSLN